MMRLFQLALPIALLSVPLTLAAQDDNVSVQIWARGGYRQERVDGRFQSGTGGFSVEHFNLFITGNITPKWSYQYYHHLNKATSVSNFFDAADWASISFCPSDKWEIMGGKQMVELGGWEYYTPPIHLFFCTEFWNQMPLFQWGLAMYRKLHSDGKIALQISGSPFRTYATDKELYAYSTSWRGQWGYWSWANSTNLFEYTTHQYMHLVVLGNRIEVGNIRFEADFIHRADLKNYNPFKDFSAVGGLFWNSSERTAVFAKLTYDVNASGEGFDNAVLDGTELLQAGAGVEFWPEGRGMNLRLHLFCSRGIGTNANTSTAVVHGNSVLFNVGITWFLSVYRS